MQDFNTIRSLFAKNLSLQLIKKDIKQADFAKMVGVSTAAVSDWCNGKKIPRMDKIDLICDKLLISRSNLLEETNDKKSPSESLQLTEEEKSLLSLFRELPPEDQSMMLEMIRVALKNRS